MGRCCDGDSASAAFPYTKKATHLPELARWQELSPVTTAFTLTLFVVNIENAKKLGEWMSDLELTWLGTQAQKSKVVIELGSWFGKSSTAIADNLPEDGVLYCIDTWAGSEA
jgi:hypothetical protein